MQTKAIQFRPELFWDVDPKIIDPKKHSRYIIARILDFGNESEAKWMQEFYSPAEIGDVVKTTRTLSRKSFNFWREYFNIDISECLQKQLKVKHSAFLSR